MICADGVHSFFVRTSVPFFLLHPIDIRPKNFIKFLFFFVAILRILPIHLRLNFEILKKLTLFVNLIVYNIEKKFL